KETPEGGRIEIEIKREGGLAAFIKRLIFGKEEIKVNMPVSDAAGKEEAGKSQLAAGDISKKEEKEKKSALKFSSPEYPLLAAACQIETVYKFPSLDLLEGDRGLPSSGDIKANANIIKRTFQNFGIEVEMGEVNVGPTVTQYTMKPAEGVKLTRITGLQNDLALALAASSVRIEAPIPGRSLVGIEVPNKAISVVGLKSLLSDSQFSDSPSFLTFALGRDVAGHSIFADLAKMPHLLVAGATGAGKSVAIHSLVVSLIYRNSPETLKFIIIDPKRVELAVYNGIPHLLAPVVIDSKKALGALRWAVKEMERRYEILSEEGARDISSFTEKIIKRRAKDKDLELLPYLVIIIDELADLMVSYRREVEASIVRLAQMARAVGIHLVVSTQRPSVEILTGLIKANITSRVALQVASQVDSRTILDMGGAEKLLGNGDMLFLAGDAGKPRRIQGTFVSEREVNRVADFLKKTADEKEESEEKDIFSAAPESSNILNFNEDDVDDELYEEAKKTVIEAGKASASFLQRRLRIGYARAARILDIMEERGIIGPADGAKPRDILVERSPDLPNDDVVKDEDDSEEI
ncbi:MAG: DNA translocase FtsK, partial [Patescibacteria group bacterium]